jgi:hypothetical protein
VTVPRARRNSRLSPIAAGVEGMAGLSMSMLSGARDLRIGFPFRVLRSDLLLLEEIVQGAARGRTKGSGVIVLSLHLLARGTRLSTVG